MKQKKLNKKKIINILNANISNDIRIYSMKLVVAKFDIRFSAKSRIYEYYMPLFIFQTFEEYQQKLPFDEEREKKTVERVYNIC